MHIAFVICRESFVFPHSLSVPSFFVSCFSFCLLVLPLVHQLGVDVLRSTACFISEVLFSLLLVFRLVGFCRTAGGSSAGYRTGISTM